AQRWDRILVTRLRRKASEIDFADRSPSLIADPMQADPQSGSIVGDGELVRLGADSDPRFDPRVLGVDDHELVRMSPPIAPHDRVQLAADGIRQERTRIEIEPNRNPADGLPPSEARDATTALARRRPGDSAGSTCARRRAP